MMMKQNLFIYFILIITIINIQKANAALSKPNAQLINSTATTLAFSLNSTGGTSLSTTYTVTYNQNVVCSSNVCYLTGLKPSTSVIMQVKAENGNEQTSTTISFLTQGSFLLTSLNFYDISLAYINELPLDFTTMNQIPSLTTFTFYVNETIIENCDVQFQLQPSSSLPICYEYTDPSKPGYFTIKNLDPKTTYNVNVTGTSEGFTSSKSHIFTTQPAIKLLYVFSTGETNHSLSITYTTNSGFNSAILYSVSLNGTLQVNCTNFPDTDCLIDGLAEDTYYEVGVTATLQQSQDTIRKVFKTTPKPVVIIRNLALARTTKLINATFESTYQYPEIVNTYTLSLNGVQVQGCQKILQKYCVISNDILPNTTYNVELMAFADGTNSTWSSDITTYQVVTEPNIYVTTAANSTLSILYKSDNGVPSGSLYNVSVDNVFVCTNTNLLQCDYSPYKNNHEYEIRVQVVNDGTLKSSSTKYTRKSGGDNSNEGGVNDGSKSMILSFTLIVFLFLLQLIVIS